MLLPYLKIKRQKAIMVIGFLELLEANHCRNLSDEQYNVYLDLYEKCKSLDSRKTFYSAGA